MITTEARSSGSNNPGLSEVDLKNTCGNNLSSLMVCVVCFVRHIPGCSFGMGLSWSGKSHVEAVQRDRRIY